MKKNKLYNFNLLNGVSLLNGLLVLNGVILLKIRMLRLLNFFYFLINFFSQEKIRSIFKFLDYFLLGAITVALMIDLLTLCYSTLDHMILFFPNAADNI
jgi:hypothetical protein